MLEGTHKAAGVDQQCWRCNCDLMCMSVDMEVHAKPQQQCMQQMTVDSSLCNKFERGAVYATDDNPRHGMQQLTIKSRYATGDNVCNW